MSDPGSLVRVERDGPIATLVLNDPRRRNAMTRAVGTALAEAVAGLREDPALRAVIVTGAGGAFSAGGDLGMLEELAERAAGRPGELRDEIQAEMRGFYGLFLSLRSLPVPSIAAIGGAAIGAGFCVALACDLRVAARDARLGLNFATLGLHPGMGATWLLPRLCGPAAAAELLYTGGSLTGEEARALGLVNAAVPADLVPARARELAERIAAASPEAVRGIKRALAHSPGASLEEQLELEARAQARGFEGADVREGLRAIRERRPPRFP